MVFSSPNVVLRELCAKFLGNPIAVSTCDGLSLPDEHAEPLDAQIPFSSNFNNNVSPSTPSNTKFAFPGSLKFLKP